MVFSLRSAASLALFASLYGCSSGDDPGANSAGLGGYSGSTFLGGSGMTAAYGGAASGAAPSASGAQPGMGSGGSFGNPSGGTPGASGTIGGAGVTSGGGFTSSGGSPISGGGISNGGASGGGTAAGGSTGACTDTPPPNGDTCAHAVQYGWCGMSWLNGACAASCKVCSAGSGGTTSSGGRTSTGGTTSSGGTTSTGGTTSSGGGAANYPPIVGGQNGWASRYWDCCKPACGWKSNVHSGNPMVSCDQGNASYGGNYDVQSACNGGTAFMCYSGAPWSINDSVSYGFAAGSGSNYVCGRCYELQFAGTGHSGANPGAQSIKGKTMIVQIVNNGGVGSDQLDLLIPGGGVGALNACSKQWNGADLGSQYGGYLAECNGDKSCVQQKCNTVFAGKADLLAGCNWFLGWYNAADNPNFVYKQIACPAAITQRSGLSDPG